MLRLWSVIKACVRVLALALGLACLVGAAAPLAARHNPWLDLPSHFAPVWLAGSLVATAMGFAFGGRRGRWPLVAVGLAGAGAALALIGPELTRPIRPPVAADSPRRLRIVQLNAWEENRDPQRAVVWLDASGADVVALEEAALPFRSALMARGFACKSGSDDTAVCSRGLRSAPTFPIPAPAWPTFPVFARQTFVMPGARGTFTVVATHMTWPNLRKFWPQRGAFVGLMRAQSSRRLIVAGDFNLTPWSRPLREVDRGMGLERRDRAIPTWPARRRLRGHLIALLPVLPIDHLYAGAGWRTVRIYRGPDVGSDHYPVVADLALEP